MGSRFFASPTLFCKFGDTVVPGVYINQGEVDCVAPNITDLPPDNATVLVTGHHLTD
jgi:hypothetical protein